MGLSPFCPILTAVPRLGHSDLKGMGSLFDFVDDLYAAANKNFPDASRRVSPIGLRGSDVCVDAGALWDVGERVVVTGVRVYSILDLNLVDGVALSEPIAKRFRARDVLGAEHAVQAAWCIGGSQLSCYFERYFPTYYLGIVDIAITAKAYTFAELPGLLSPVSRRDAVAGFPAPVADAV